MQFSHHSNNNGFASVAATQPAPCDFPGSQRFVTVLDPAFKAGLLQIPLEKTFETKGRNEWLRGLLRKDLSLCCLFQKGRCHAEENCHQVHADRAHVEALRAQLARIISCCAHCHDTASHAPAALSFFATHFGCGTRVVVATTDGSGAFNEIAADRVAYTTGLVQHFDALPLSEQQLAAGGVVVLPGKKVCRLHLRAACKYGKDCKSLHVCSTLTEDVLRCLPTSLPHPPAIAAQLHHQHQQPSSLRAPLAIGTGFAERALVAPPQHAPAPQSAVSQQQQQPPRPMPTFAAIARVPETVAAVTGRASIERDPLHMSCSDSQLDAVDFNESSGRLSGIIFDPKRALEESRRTGALRVDPEEAEMWFGATSPSQKRRGSASSDATSSYGASSSLNHADFGAFAAGNAAFFRVFA